MILNHMKMFETKNNIKIYKCINKLTNVEIIFVMYSTFF